MKTGYYEPKPDIKPALLRELLLGLSVSPEIGARLGVPVEQLEQWLRDLAGHVNGRSCPMRVTKYPKRAGRARQRPNGRVLSAGEISFLLNGFDAPQV